jgi:hypothetical protein
MKEDPTRDPASEARDDWEQLCQPLTDEERRENARKIEALSVPDRFALMFSHASEPRETPRTDAECVKTGHPGAPAAYLNAEFARRLERQRDELMEALELLLQHHPRADWEGLTIAETLAWDNAEDAIAAVKGVHT